MQNIIIRGARTHNLKNIDVQIPRDKLVVITGLSGSGKSSLAFDTLFAEGQRRYVESLSTYARQFIATMNKPDVDAIEGLSPAVAIQQKSTSHNPRSTVGTITEIHDYLRLLFARIGQPVCPIHKIPLAGQAISQMVEHIMQLPKDAKIMLMAPVVREQKGEHLELIKKCQARGYSRALVNGHIYELNQIPPLAKNQKHNIDIVVDRLKVQADLEQRLADSLQATIELGEGSAILLYNDERTIFSIKYACPHCDYSAPKLEPKLFSFNSPAGACSGCEGLGTKLMIDPKSLVNNPKSSINQGAIEFWHQDNRRNYEILEKLSLKLKFSLDTPLQDLGEELLGIIFNGNDSWIGILPTMQKLYDNSKVQHILHEYVNELPCPICSGSRLNKSALNVMIEQYNLPQVGELSLGNLQIFFKNLKLQGQKEEIAKGILREINSRLQFLCEVGLEYLSLNRKAGTLSGGESQRIRLASQIGSGLVGVMYVLDEPSIGLHQRDNAKLIASLEKLRDLGNTVIVVEHDEDTMLHADYVLDIGPGSGELGGLIVAEGTAKELMQNPNSLTGKYLSGKEQIAIPKERRKPPKDKLSISAAKLHNLQNINVDIPLKVLTVVVGVSGSGKSTLINEILYQEAMMVLNHNRKSSIVSGLGYLDKVIDIDQSPIGRTPRSNPATYTGIFNYIRELFAATTESRSRGYKIGRFSFNVAGGRCESCQGEGMVRVEMHFLADVFVPCDLCQAKRYNYETLQVKYKGKNISEVLDMTVREALEFFDAVSMIRNRLQVLADVGLSYIRLGQSATTLSGGEAQRIKLSKELAKRDTGNTLYILDEPTTGLHFQDVKMLLSVLQRLVDKGNSVLVIEHNLDLIKSADWLIELGPEGGDQGGQLVATGTPEDVAKSSNSHTAPFLRHILERGY